MTIDGVYYTEPKLMAKFRQMQETIERLEGENYKLTERIEEVRTALNDHVDLVLWHEEREKEYKRLLKMAVEDFVRIDEVKLLPENTIRPMLEYTNIIDIVRHKWRYADEALKLIGDESSGI